MKFINVVKGWKSTILGLLLSYVLALAVLNDKVDKDIKILILTPGVAAILKLIGGDVLKEDKKEDIE